MTMQSVQNGAANKNETLLATSLGIRPDMKEEWVSFGNDGVPFDKGVQVLIDAHKRDGGDITDVQVSDLRRMVFGASGTEIVMGDTQTGDKYKIRRSGWGGLMAHLSAGVGVTDLMLHRLPPVLQLANLNALMAREKADHPAVLRVRNGEVLAIVSRKYAALDTADLAQMARDALQKDGLLSGAMVRAVAYGGRDVIRVMFPEKNEEVKAGDIVSRGVDFRNGSWGGSAIELTTSLIRLVCTNGMIRDEEGRTGFHFRHVSSNDKIRQRVADALPKALAGGEEIIHLFRDSLNVELQGINALFNGLPDDTLVSEKEIIRNQLKDELGVNVLNPKDGFSLFHGVNAITAAARSMATERRLAMEKAAGDILARS